jgi:hypothetical protein
MFFFPLRQKEPKSASAGRTWLKSTLHSGKIAQTRCAQTVAFFSTHYLDFYAITSKARKKVKNLMAIQLTLFSTILSQGHFKSKMIKPIENKQVDFWLDRS